MEPNGIPPEFWEKFIPLMGVIIILLVGIPAVVRGRLGADKKKWFSYNHINEFHKKSDWTIRFVFIVFNYSWSNRFYPKPPSFHFLYRFYLR